MNRRLAWYAFFLVTLVIVNGIIVAYALRPDALYLSVSFLAVGQGDAILIESPVGTKVLIDGGPDRSVLRALGGELLPWERRIDAVVATHPDKDHIAGLPEVFERYAVTRYIESGVPGATSFSEHLEKAVDEERGVERVTARRGMRIHLGAGAYADVLYPDHDQSAQKETNAGSITLHVVYGERSFLLSGDLPSPLEDRLVALDEVSLETRELRSDVLKAGHHGSRTSTDAVWLDAVRPHYVVISAGKQNSYGHPHPEVIERIRTARAEIVSTAESGTLTFVTDGKRLELRSK